ncbi:MAG: flagellar biosynthesis protein FlhF [Burkholderiaceae bacterium]
MTPKKYIAPTARAALERVRAELGPDAVILRNRAIDGGVEILAVSDQGLDDAARQARTVAAEPERSPQSESTSAPRTNPEDRVPAQTMSTVSFESFARQRKAKRSSQVEEAVKETPPDVGVADRAGAPLVRAAPVPVVGAGTLDGLVQEMRSIRSYIGEQFTALSWVDGVRRTPVQARLLRLLLEAGFSARLARALVSRLPGDYGDDEALVWLHASLARNLDCDDWRSGVLSDEGVFALVGPTGVGKTTTAAKMAAHCALRHGPQSVGLITADGYRIGARDQLRDFGQLIGVSVHVARDVESLNESLQLFARKRLVLIDTAGVGQRDSRVADVLGTLSASGVRRLLVVSAAAQRETIDEVVAAYCGGEGAGVVLSKTDEACRLGGALDVVIRKRLLLVGVADGQRVPEDWHEPDAAALVSQALEPRPDEEFGLGEVEMAMTMQRLEPVGGRGRPEIELEVADV